MNFYAPLPPNGSTLQQGDLLAGVPFTYFPLRSVKVALANKRPAKRNLVENPTDVKFIAASVEFDWGIVLSQTCDVQPDPITGFARKPILVARVRPIKELFKNLKDSTLKEAIGNVKNLATAGKSPTPTCQYRVRQSTTIKSGFPQGVKGSIRVPLYRSNPAPGGDYFQ